MQLVDNPLGQVCDNLGLTQMEKDPTSYTATSAKIIDVVVSSAPDIVKRG